MTNSIPITIRGKRYPSMSAAARALGISPRTLHEAKEHNNGVYPSSSIGRVLSGAKNYQYGVTSDGVTSLYAAKKLG